MDWTADEEIGEQLMRIVALLLGLSVLAERAGRAPLGMRVSVMELLRPAEQVAWDFVAGEATTMEPAGADDDPAAAMHLAVRFRALAFALAAIARRFGGRRRIRRVGKVPVAADAAGDFAGPCRARPQPFDTS